MFVAEVEGLRRRFFATPFRVGGRVSMMSEKTITSSMYTQHSVPGRFLKASSISL
jgi:hypothetical protein